MFLDESSLHDVSTVLLTIILLWSLWCWKTERSGDQIDRPIRILVIFNMVNFCVVDGERNDDKTVRNEFFHLIQSVANERIL